MKMKMPQLKFPSVPACCCFDLKTGCIMIGILGLVSEGFGRRFCSFNTPFSLDWVNIDCAGCWTGAGYSGQVEAVH
jgi:hypothetical protein